ncbi:hypothetical protein BVRB_3g061110 [Beta vulgaris subsp. vulgaris]|nr:hypothetical protein BVRB_3g061110 [Beta vulgaris subsp. vulgaris]
MATTIAMVAAVNAQEMAPSPAPVAGAGFSLNISTVAVAFPLLFSLFSIFKN